jgi:YidC/Oxa1 family membrane protein insertase
VIVGFNPLRPIEDLLTNLLEWFHSTANLTWAWSIVALVVLVRLILVPVTVRQIHSMQNLQAHAPEMKEIQQRWKHDRQRQNEELMKFYRENKINPAASCLPIVLQIPIFISLFYVLKDFEKEIFPQYPESSLEFLGLVDITEPTVDGWGPVLLVVYVISQLTSSYFMSTSMQKAQRVLLLVLPIVFIPFILNFPSGLMIYWLTTNLWTTGQGLVTRKLMPKPDLTALQERRSSRTPPKDDGAAQQSDKAKAKPNAATADGATATADGARPKVAGPPRRVKKKRSGGGRRR